MKKLLLALTLLLAPTAAFAQCNGGFPPNSTCGTLAGGPPGPIAFTSIPASLIVGSTTVSPSNTDVLFNNSGLLGASSTFTFTPTGGIVLAPAALSNNPALTISQSTPNSGTIAGPITLNGATIIDNAQTITGSVLDQWGQITNQTDGFRLNYRVTGGLANHFAFNVPVDITATNGGTVGIIASCQVNVGTITGDCWTNIAVGNIGPSGNLNQSMIGYEAEMLIQDTGVGKDLIGFSANSQGPTAATRYHEAYSISTSNQGLPHFMTGIPWTVGFHINAGLYGAGYPIATTGSFILSDTGTLANFISAHTTTVTGNVLDFPSVNITGAGAATFGTGSASIFNFVQVKCGSCGFSELAANINGTTTTDGMLAQDSAGTDNLFVGVSEASNSTTRFGQTIGNWAQVLASGTTNVGLVIGTFTSEPMILGTNNTAVMTIAGSGAVSIAAAVTITSASAGALRIGPNGATNPTFQVDDSISSAANGVYIQSSAAGAGANITTISSATNEPLKINAKGSGTIDLGGTSSGGVTVHTSFTATGLVTNADLVSPTTTVNGQSCTLGSTCTVTATASSTLTIGTHLTGTSYNGSSPVTIATDATNANTVSTIVARDGSGNFTAGTITAALTGHASADCILTGCTMSGAIAMGTNAITGLTTLAATGTMTIQSGGSTFAGSINGSQQVLFGTNTTAPTGPTLTVTRNAATLPALGSLAPTIQTAAADGNGTNIVLQTFGTAVFGGVRYGGARGTAASPTAIQAGDIIGGNNAYGYQTGTNAFNPGAGFFFVATENFTATNNGTRTDIYGTANGSTFPGSASISVGAGTFTNGNTDPGSGNINATVYFAGGTTGLASKSCAITTANVATGITLTIKGGIITGTTTC